MPHTRASVVGNNGPNLWGWRHSRAGTRASATVRSMARDAKKAAKANTAANPKKAKTVLEELGRPGPHEVLHGDLALVGLPGVVYTPRSGLGLPAVAFGHGWLQPASRYAGLLRHLASWGIVAAAPATQRGPMPSHRLFAADL